MRQGTAVYVFQLATQGDAVGDAGDFDAARADQFADVVGGGFALHGGIGGENDFAHCCRVQALGESVEADLLRLGGQHTQKGSPWRGSAASRRTREMLVVQLVLILCTASAGETMGMP